MNIKTSNLFAKIVYKEVTLNLFETNERLYYVSFQNPCNYEVLESRECSSVLEAIKISEKVIDGELASNKLREFDLDESQNWS